MASFPSNVGPGLFVPTTEIFDVSRFKTKSITDSDFSEFMVRLTQVVNDIALAVNQKDSAIYSQEEFVNGQTFFRNLAVAPTGSTSQTQRQVFRKVINFGALPNAGTTSVAHGITIDNNFTLTRLYGAASDVGASKEYIPLPFVDVAGTVAAGNVELHMDGTNINITTTGNGTNFTVCYVIIEYLKN